MEIYKELLSTLDLSDKVKEVRVGFFHTAVVTRNCGLASTLPHDAPHQEQPSLTQPDLLVGKSASELANMVFSPNTLEAAIGMATINSALTIDEHCCLRLNARDLIMEKGRNKKVAMVGHFPFATEIRKTVKTLWVIEKNPREGDFPEADAEHLIPEAQVVGITGTAFTNHSITHLLKLCQPKAYVVVLGATAPLSPILFRYGVDAVSGTKVVEPNVALDSVSQGVTYRQIQGVRKLTMMKCELNC